MPDHPAALLTIYAGWDAYQRQLAQALAPLSAEQLALRAAPGLRSIGALAAHIAGGRAYWFHDVIGEGSAAIAHLPQWQDPAFPPLTAAELVAGFDVTWGVIHLTHRTLILYAVSSVALAKHNARAARNLLSIFC